MYKVGLACILLTLVYGQSAALITLDRDGNKQMIITKKQWQQQLALLLDALKISVIMDIGCGLDLWWTDAQLIERDYLGIDNDPDIIAQLRKKHTDEHHHFLCLDVSVDSVPQVDMIICSDLFAEFDEKQLCDALRAMKSSGSTFLLATTHDHKGQAEDHEGAYDLTKAPCNLCEPLVCIEQGSKKLGLWLLRDLDLSNLKY